MNLLEENQKKRQNLLQKINTIISIRETLGGYEINIIALKAMLSRVEDLFYTPEQIEDFEKKADEELRKFKKIIN